MFGAYAFAIVLSTANSSPRTAPSPQGRPERRIQVNNLPADRTVFTPLVILRGDGVEAASVVVDGVPFPAREGRWAGVAELKPGKNTIELRDGSEIERIEVRFVPMKTPYVVKVGLLLASDEEPQTPQQGTPAKTRLNDRLDTSLKLIQAFSADSMNERGYGPKTFPLELDPSGRLVVHVIKSDKTGAQLRAMEGGDIWGHIYDLTQKADNREESKWCVFVQGTDFDASTQKARAHFALGGGQLAGFGGGTLGYWPRDRAEIPVVFGDTTRLDHTKIFEDSAYRRTVATNVSTALGATLHEMGHTFGLPHDWDGQSIMTRGFDLFNRRFMAYEPAHARREQGGPVNVEDSARWSDIHAARLNLSPWFQPFGLAGGSFDRTNPPVIRLEGDRVTVEAKHGLALFATESDSTRAVFQRFDPWTPASLTRSRAELLRQMGGKSFWLVAVDAQGNWASEEVKP